MGRKSSFLYAEGEFLVYFRDLTFLIVSKFLIRITKENLDWSIVCQTRHAMEVYKSAAIHRYDTCPS